MPLADFAKRLLSLSQTIYQWLGQLAGLNGQQREKVALYAEEIAATLARAAIALAALETQPADKQRVLATVRELGRISGYVETIVGTLEHHLDGRKLAGVKRRLERLERGAEVPTATSVSLPAAMKIHAGHLMTAEGYFRALADALRA